MRLPALLLLATLVAASLASVPAAAATPPCKPCAGITVAAATDPVRLDFSLRPR